MKDSRHIIWTDYLDYDDWKEDLEAQYPELSANERMNLMYEINGTYFQDEKTNLDIQLSRPILVVGDLGLWHGRRMGYKEIESGNISDCLYTERDIDNATWFVDKNGDFRCEAIHHDGTNHYLYRAYKDGVSETQIDNLKEKIYRGINANPNDRFDYENYYDTFFSVNFTVGNYDFPLEFRPNYGGISILIPESRMPEFNAEITSKEIMIQSPNYANIQKNTTDYLTSVGLAEDVSIFSSAESYESQRNFAAMIKLFSTSFLILLTVISCANVFNVITTSLNMRKREFAVLRSVGMTVNKLFAMLCIENLRNGLLAILIGGISSLPLCYLIYKSIVVGAVIDFVFPLGAFVISSLAMFLIMFLTSLYGLWKIKNGDIIADVRNDFV